MNDDQNEALKLVRRGIALEMRLARALRRDRTASRYLQGHDIGWISCLNRIGLLTKRMIKSPGDRKK
jgi:hypothetical protein